MWTQFKLVYREQTDLGTYCFPASNKKCLAILLFFVLLSLPLLTVNFVLFLILDLFYMFFFPLKLTHKIRNKMIHYSDITYKFYHTKRNYSQTCLKWPLKWTLRIVFQDAKCRSNVLQNAPREHSGILWTCIKLPFVFKTFVLPNFERPLKTGLTVSISL